MFCNPYGLYQKINLFFGQKYFQVILNLTNYLHIRLLGLARRILQIPVCIKSPANIRTSALASHRNHYIWMRNIPNGLGILPAHIDAKPGLHNLHCPRINLFLWN